MKGQICEKLIKHDGRECLCVRSIGHKGQCIPLVHPAWETDAFLRGIEVMRTAAVDAARRHSAWAVAEAIAAIPSFEESR